MNISTTIPTSPTAEEAAAILEKRILSVADGHEVSPPAWFTETVQLLFNQAGPQLTLEIMVGNTATLSQLLAAAYMLGSIAVERGWFYEMQPQHPAGY